MRLSSLAQSQFWNLASSPSSSQYIRLFLDDCYDFTNHHHFDHAQNCITPTSPSIDTTHCHHSYLFVRNHLTHPVFLAYALPFLSCSSSLVSQRRPLCISKHRTSHSSFSFGLFRECSSLWSFVSFPSYLSSYVFSFAALSRKGSFAHN